MRIPMTQPGYFQDGEVQKLETVIMLPYTISQ